MSTIAKLLVANRGEIARRIIRTARRLGIATVAVASEADRGAPFVREADECVQIGPPPAAQSYLDGGRIIRAARETGADAIHPGYGFLSESADFADAVAAAGLVFVGPPPEAMRAAGDKAKARMLAAGLGVPVVPGSEDASADEGAIARSARSIGFPVMIKAAAGGGGRGMRRIDRDGDLANAVASARREAAAAFGDGRLIVEKAIERPRHVEIQVFGDAHGNLVHLGERECSLQRHHQKVMEEAPAPGMSEGLRAELCAAALRIAREVGYRNAGTFEFLVEGGTLDAGAPYYFIEANPRLQVEHPVTEAITGLDLVEWQIRVARGEPLPLGQDDIRFAGHAVEVRVCAEDPAHGFRPDAGRVVDVRWPRRSGIRVESAVEPGTMVPPDYDSLILKAIAHAPGRATALAEFAAWLADSAVLGVRTNMGFLASLVGLTDVVAGRLDTGLVGREIAVLAPIAAARDAAVAHGVHVLLAEEMRRCAPAGPVASPWDATDGFALGGTMRQRRKVVVDGAPREVSLRWSGGGPVVRSGDVEFPANPIAPGLVAVYDERDDRVLVSDQGRQIEVRRPRHDEVAGTAGGGGLTAPITGRVAKLAVVAGERIEKGTVVAVVEAMKMEHVLVAPQGGVVVTVLVAEGAQVAAGAPIAEIRSDDGVAGENGA